MIMRASRWRTDAIRRLFALRRREAELCRVSDHLGAGSLLRYGRDRYGDANDRCPHCAARLGDLVRTS